MKILGISGSPREEKTSNCFRLTQRVLDNTNCDFELISLRGRNIHGCIACLGCVKDNICKVVDDMVPLREKIVEADAYVIAAPNYFFCVNALTHAFLERWYQFRHQEGNLLWGKLAVVIGIGGSKGQIVSDQIELMLGYSFIETIAKVDGQGAACCFTCGYGETCNVGAVTMMYGPNTRITEDRIPDIAKQPEVLKTAADAGKLLGDRLRTNHDRKQVTDKMQNLMMERFKGST